MIEVSYYELVIFAIFLLATEPPPNLFQFNGKVGVVSLVGMRCCDVRAFFLVPDDRMRHAMRLDARCEALVIAGLLEVCG